MHTMYVSIGGGMSSTVKYIYMYSVKNENAFDALYLLDV